MNSELKTGDIMFGPIGGVVPGLVPVGIGQLLLFFTRRWWHMIRSIRSWFEIRHVGVIVRGQASYVVQAMPGGVEMVDFDPLKHFTSKHLYVRPDYQDVDQAGDVANAALDYVGTPYNFLTYVKLAAGAFRMRLTEQWLIKHMSTRADMMCSQHIDQSLTDAGYHVFEDGRLPQDVVPAELLNALIRRPGWVMIPGHSTVGTWTHTSRLAPTK